MTRQLRLRDCKVGQQFKLSSGLLYEVRAYNHNDVYCRRVYPDGNDGYRVNYKDDIELLSGNETVELI